MKREANASLPQLETPSALRQLTAWGVAGWLIYAAITWLSWQFSYVEPQQNTQAEYALLRQRPILEVLLLFGAAFVCYLGALRVAVRCPAGRRLVEVIVVFAVCFRGLLLVSEPIQEVDVYRYLWDGAAATAGVSPFRYSPQQVIESRADDDLPAELRRLVQLRDSAPPLATILNRVHYGKLPTVYPPVSQAVFAAANFTTRAEASVRARVIIMRCWLLIFDLATVWILLLILGHVGKPPGWAVAYAWCPLVMKEFANSGHLDSIAVCLTTAAIYLTLKAFYKPRRSGDATRTASHLSTATLAAAVLAIAIGAKLYPVVLVPLLAAVSLRRLGWRRTLLPAVMFVTLTGVLCYPMLPRDGWLGSSFRAPSARMSWGLRSEDSASTPATPDQFKKRTDHVGITVRSQSAGLPPQHVTTVSVDPQDPSRGLSTFFSRWEMNDFLFLILVENIDPAIDKPSANRAWFVFTSQRAREKLVAFISQRFSVDPARVPFLLTRMVTSGILILLVFWWSWRRGGTGDGGQFLEAAFLILAWFWLLLPTQNPWYWIWVLPLVPFARSRVWLMLGGLTLLYYSRFWLGYHWPNANVPGSRYEGLLFFDFVISWVEFGPWFAWLAIDYVMFRRKAHFSAGVSNNSVSG